MLKRAAVGMASTLMRKFPASPRRDDLSLGEIFRQVEYTAASSADQDKRKLAASRWRYEDEARNSSLVPFLPAVSPDDLRGKSVLDLGSNTGGRLICWKERYALGRACGIDISPTFEQASKLLARERGVDVEFRTGFGESLPWPNDAFDFVISTDVLEHVRDVEQCMNECLRVLKPGGRMLARFPQFLQPYESHLGLITPLPALHWVFSGKTITRAAYDVLANREDARWYAPSSPELAAWEHLPSLNGISASRFRSIVQRQGWKVILQDRSPVRMARPKPGRPLFNLVRLAVVAAARVPFVEELLLDRLCYVLEKPGQRS